MELTATDVVPELASMRGGAATAAGLRRSANEDAHLCGPDWFAVADGMGGHRGGGIASRLAIDLVRRSPGPGSVDAVREVIAAANDRIRRTAREEGPGDMGATLVAATRHADGVAVAHIGDARCYRMVGGALSLLTRDHSHVQELVDLGRITPAEVGTHRLRHVVTRALGTDAVARPDVVVVPAPVGRLLLCSDGLADALTSQAIGRVLVAIEDPQWAAERLVQLAVGGDATDDVTAIVVDHVGGAR